MNEQNINTPEEENTQPSKFVVFVGLEESQQNLKTRILHDAYHGVSRLLNAPIELVSGICQLPRAIAQSWGNSKHDKNTVSHDISPMSLLWLLLAGGTVGAVLLLCFGDVASVTRRVAVNIKALQQVPEEFQTTLQPPAQSLGDVVERQARKEAFEQICREKGGEVLPNGRYPLGVYTVRGGGESDGYLTYTTIAIPTGNACTFSPGNAAEAFQFEQFIKRG